MTEREGEEAVRAALDRVFESFALHRHPGYAMPEHEHDFLLEPRLRPDYVEGLGRPRRIALDKPDLKGSNWVQFLSPPDSSAGDADIPFEAAAA